MVLIIHLVAPDTVATVTVLAVVVSTVMGVYAPSLEWVLTAYCLPLTLTVALLAL